MKKILTILMAVALCVSLCTAASAASYENLSADEIAAILGVDVDDLNDLENLASNLGKDTSVTTTAAAGTTAAGDALGGLGEILGGVDISAIAGSLSGGDDTLATLTGIFESLDLGSFDVTSLVDMITGAFGEGGLDLSALTSGLDLGSFDIASLLGGLGGSSSSGSSDSSSSGSSSSGGDTASGATDMMSSIMDGLMSGLSGLGIDTSMIEGLLDNDIVNFFANLYIGLGGVSDGGEVAETTQAVVTTSAVATTSKPAVVTTSTPKTGDTSSVVAAIAALSVASAAAFVCLKKKED